LRTTPFTVRWLPVAFVGLRSRYVRWIAVLLPFTAVPFTRTRLRTHVWVVTTALRVARLRSRFTHIYVLVGCRVYVHAHGCCYLLRLDFATPRLRIYGCSSHARFPCHTRLGYGCSFTVYVVHGLRYALHTFGCYGYGCYVYVLPFPGWLRSTLPVPVATRLLVCWLGYRTFVPFYAHTHGCRLFAVTLRYARFTHTTVVGYGSHITCRFYVGYRTLHTLHVFTLVGSPVVRLHGCYVYTRTFGSPHTLPVTLHSLRLVTHGYGCTHCHTRGCDFYVYVS